MKNIPVGTYILLILSFMCMSSAMATGNDKLDFEIIYTASIKNIPNNAGHMKIWIPYPKSDDYQQIYSIKVSSPYPTYIHEEPVYGNSFLYLEIEKPDLKEIEIRMNILASRKVEIHQIEADQIGELTQTERNGRFDKYFIDDLDTDTRERVKIIVQEHIVDQPSYLDKVKAIYDYVYESMDYRKDIPGYGKGNVNRACEVKSGNCVDFHSLFVAIAREAGIVATEVANIDLPFEEGVPNYCSASYHCNVEVYLPNYGWFPMDISHAKKGKGSKEYYFGTLDNLRLKLGRGRNIQLTPLQEGAEVDRLYHHPFVFIDGEVHSEVDVNVLATTYDRESMMNRRPYLIAAGEPAESFNWVDLNGNPFIMKDFLGKKPIVVNFFSTWCGRCIWETEGLEKAYSEYKDIEFVRINLMEEPEKVKEFISKHKISYTVLPDERGELAKLFGIKYVPTNIIIDRNGKVLFSGGLLDENDLFKHLKKLKSNI